MSVGIKDVDFAKSGESKVSTPFEVFEHSHIKTPEQPVGTGRRIFKLFDTKKTGRVWIDGIDDVLKDGKVERIRLLRGVNTIWMKEQKDLDKDYISRNRRSLMFENQICVLNDTDIPAIEFAMNCNHLITDSDSPKAKTSKHSFYEWNPLAQEKAALAKEMLEIEVMQLAMAQTFDKVKKHAAFLGGINFFDEYGNPRSEDGIRTLYVIAAKRNPTRFKNTINSKEVDITYLIKRAISETKIDLGGNTGNISWANGGLICRLPKGRGAVEYLVEFAMMPTDESKTFVEHLQKNIS